MSCSNCSGLHCAASLRMSVTAEKLKTLLLVFITRRQLLVEIREWICGAHNSHTAAFRVETPRRCLGSLASGRIVIQSDNYICDVVGQANVGKIPCAARRPYGQTGQLRNR